MKRISIFIAFLALAWSAEAGRRGETTRSELVSFMQREVSTHRSGISYSMEYLGDEEELYVFDLKNGSARVLLNPRNGDVTIDGEFGVLSKEDRLDLIRLAKQEKISAAKGFLTLHHHRAQTMRHHYNTIALAEVLAASPEGMDLTHLVARGNGVVCARIDTMTTATWSDRHKREHSMEVEVGSTLFYEGQDGDFSCMGRCGEGCTPPMRFTQDCLNHDSCAFNHHTDQGTPLRMADPDCGKGWMLAIDDFLFGKDCDVKRHKPTPEA